MNTKTALATALATLALIPLTASADPAGTGWNLVFSDDFNGTAVDTTKWTYRTDVKTYSAQRPENVTVAGNVMSINLKQESFGGRSFTGGGLVSIQRFRYGYYETRAKINPGSGWHSAFWMMAGDGTTIPPDRRTEIDGFEIDSNLPTWLKHNVITWRGASDSQGPVYVTKYYNIGMDLSADWHTYGVDWEESAVKYYVDGVLEATQAYAPSQWTHDMLAIWLTTVSPYLSPDPAYLPSASQFARVRYWQKDFYVDNDGPLASGYSETGTWATSGLSGWTYGSPTRYATCGSAGNTATWRPSLLSAGTYEVFAYKVAYSSSDPAARYDVAGSTTFVDGTSGTSGWVSLGVFNLPQGNATAVQLTSSGTGCARADAVKFVRQP